mmetsp:Transcript_2169/g.7825  ORF Transcript_2169/g.7825 Transcript_2169/m.7825 type:complete len:281 (-) Transcript_2169:32-874(-)
MLAVQASRRFIATRWPRASHVSKHASASVRFCTSLSQPEKVNPSNGRAEARLPASCSKLDALRAAYVRQQLCQHRSLNPLVKAPLHGQRILEFSGRDPGLAPALARLGAQVASISPAEATFVPSDIPSKQGSVEVHCSSAELVDRSFDAVVSLDCLERKDVDVAGQVSEYSRLLKDQGLLVLSTLNRTATSFLLTLPLGSWYLGLPAAGREEWDQFIQPVELAVLLERHRLEVVECTGVSFDRFSSAWQLNQNISALYTLTAVTNRAAEPTACGASAEEC